VSDQLNEPTEPTQLQIYARRIEVLEAAVRQVVKRSPFKASPTGVTVELTFDTIKLLQAALKGSAPETPAEAAARKEWRDSLASETFAKPDEPCRIHEYDGAFKCLTHQKVWGAIPNAGTPCAGWAAPETKEEAAARVLSDPRFAKEHMETAVNPADHPPGWLWNCADCGEANISAVRHQCPKCGGSKGAASTSNRR
jgi:hypothetical protein